MTPLLPPTGWASLWQLHLGDARRLPLADRSVHCIVTSPPYWMQRRYKTIDPACIGMEPTVEQYIANLVDVFRECWRVLRDDGTMWVNLGDVYGGSGSGGGGNQKGNESGEVWFQGRATSNLEGMAGQLLGLPWRVAFALQADGWILRQDVIWAKPCCLPESVDGWKWRRCRVKVGSDRETTQGYSNETGRPNHSGSVVSGVTWADCPGCPKCDSNGGLVLDKGSWRSTRSHEYIFQFVKQMGYFADREGVATPSKDDRGSSFTDGRDVEVYPGLGMGERQESTTANRRSVWADIHPHQLSGKLGHYATFPPDLPKICIKASTSEKGCCPECGAPWARVVEHTNGVSKDAIRRWHGHYARGGVGDTVGTVGQSGSGPIEAKTLTLGWRATCQCPAQGPVPALILDPFAGMATTLLAAAALGRRSVGMEISEEYLKVASQRLDLLAPRF